MSVIQFSQRSLMTSRQYPYDCSNCDNKKSCDVHSSKLDREELYDRVIFTMNDSTTSNYGNVYNINCRVERGVLCPGNKNINDIEPIESNVKFGTNEILTTHVDTFDFKSDETNMKTFRSNISMMEEIIINDINTYFLLMKSIKDVLDACQKIKYDEFVFDIFNANDYTKQLCLDVFSDITKNALNASNVSDELLCSLTTTLVNIFCQCEVEHIKCLSNNKITYCYEFSPNDCSCGKCTIFNFSDKY